MSGVLAARLLGPELRGEYVAAITLAGLCGTLLTLGGSQAVVTYRGPDAGIRGPLLLQSLLAAVLGTAVFLVLRATGQGWLTTVGVAGGGLWTAGTLITATNAGLAQRTGRMAGAFQQVRLLPQAAGLVAVGVLWLAGDRRPDHWLLAVGGATAGSAAVLFVGMLGGPRSVLAPGSLRPPRQLLRQAGQAFLVVVGAQLVYRLDSVLVALYLPATQVAMYAVAVAASGACASIGWAVGMVTFSDLRAIADPARRRAVLRSSTALAVGVTAAVAVPLAVLAPWAIRVVYGPAFTAAAGPTRVLVLAAIPLAADYLLLHALLSLSGARAAVAVQTVVVVLTVVALGVAVGSGNLVAVALVSLLTYSVSASLLFGVAQRRTRPAAVTGAPGR